jgi:GNAT superfamily N-acetyltransferase
MRHALHVIDYRTGLEGIECDQLEGFFDGWPAAPSADALLKILRGSAFAVLACDRDHVVGFVSALSDGLLAVYIPLLEVRTSYRGRGIGRELVGRVLSEFSDAYMVDALCDPEVAPFYERLGMTRLAGMAHRNWQAPILRATR